MPLNLHRLFSGAPEKDYISALAVGSRKEDLLRSARDEIRATLRTALGNVGKLASKKVLFESTAVVPHSLQPKFKMQGSFSYRTCNDPAQKPPQEVDLDDGMFVPVTFLQISGYARPALLSKGLFDVVETALKPLCDKRGWRLIQKPSCVRIRLTIDAHIDIALYSIPDGEYATLVEKSLHAQDTIIRADAQDSLAHDELPEEVYRQLARSQIMLAHRIEGWKPSDPRKLEDWFRDAIKKHGEHLRRVCRYLKGWRDYNWEECRLSSIILMAAVIDAFDKNPELAKLSGRDDKALLQVCEKLAVFFGNEIPNPVVPSQRLDENWSVESRAEFIAEAKQLLHHVRSAISGSSPAIAITELQSMFGDRIPSDAKLVANDNDLEFKSAIATPALHISEDEKLRRAEVASRQIEARGQQSTPWIKIEKK